MIFQFVITVAVSNFIFALSLDKDDNNKPNIVKPNIVIFLADDWGWNNVGFHAKNNANRKEIITPNIDSLAYSGIILVSGNIMVDYIFKY